MRLCIWAVPVVLATGSMPSIAGNGVSSYTNQTELSEDDDDTDDNQSSNITQESMRDFWIWGPDTDTDNDSETMSIKTSTISIDINDDVSNAIDRKQFSISKFIKNKGDLKTPKNKFCGDKTRHRLLKRINRINDTENTTNCSYSFQTHAPDVFTQNHRGQWNYNFMPLGKGTHPKKKN